MPRTAFAAPDSVTSFVPLASLFPSFLWPEDRLEGGAGLLERVYATGWSVAPGAIEVSLFADAPVVLGLPAIDGLELVLAAPDDGSGAGTEVGLRLAYDADGGWTLTLVGVSVTLRWDTDLLVAMEDDAEGGYVETGQPFGVTLTGDVTLHDDGTLDLGACAQVALPPVQMGRTGVVAHAAGLTPYFGAGPLPPGLEALGYGPEFRGLYVEEAAVALPASWGGTATAATYTAPPPSLEAVTDSAGRMVPSVDGASIPQPPAQPLYVGPRITFAKCAFGNGGFSGELTFDVDHVTDLGEDPLPNLVGAVDPGDRLEDAAAGVSGLSAELFGFGLALQRVELSIRHGAIVASAIDGSLRVPFLDTWFDVEVAVTGDGGFEVSLATESGAPLVQVTIEGVLQVVIDAVGVDDLVPHPP